MKAGDHVRIRLDGTWRHAIDVGDRTLIYFEPGQGVKRSRIEALGDAVARVEVVTHTARVYAPRMVVARAFSRFSESAYARMFPDSEAFAVWCKTGRVPARAALPSLTPAPRGSSNAATPRGSSRRKARKAARKAAARPKRSKARRKSAVAPRKSGGRAAAGKKSASRRPKTRPRRGGSPRPAASGRKSGRPPAR